MTSPDTPTREHPRGASAAAKPARVAALIVAALAAAAVLTKSVTPPSPLAAVSQPVQAARIPDDLRGKEQKLLDPGTFAHAIDVPAPDVSFLDADGRDVRLDSLRGKVVMVSFWATWCPPCVHEMPAMIELGRAVSAAHPKKFQMVTVSADDSWEAVHEFFRRSVKGVPPAITIARDPDGLATRSLYCLARGYCPDIKFPETYVVNRKGRVIAMIVGPRDWSGPEPRRLLESLLTD